MPYDIPDFQPWEIVALTDAELDALFDFLREALYSLTDQSPERDRLCFLLQQIRFEYRRRLEVNCNWTF